MLANELSPGVALTLSDQQVRVPAHKDEARCCAADITGLLHGQTLLRGGCWISGCWPMVLASLLLLSGMMDLLPTGGMISPWL
ncbi:MAG: hypothetical protein WKF40_04120 [Thermoleophilaceae bacterium]